MALLERVSTLIRANLNDLIDKAEHPEKMIKQIILDMENQLLQVKTQVAIAIADQHLLEKKQKENEEKIAEWTRKAELALDKQEKIWRERQLNAPCITSSFQRVLFSRHLTRSFRWRRSRMRYISCRRSCTKRRPGAKCWWLSIAGRALWKRPRMRTL